MHCDRGMSRSAVRTLPGAASFVENPQGSCKYELHLYSGAACGVGGDPFDIIAPASVASRPGDNFGFIVLGALLCVGLQYATGWANARGYLAGLPPAVQAWIPGGPSKAGYAFANAGAGMGSGGASASTPLGGKSPYGSL